MSRGSPRPPLLVFEVAKVVAVLLGFVGIGAVEKSEEDRLNGGKDEGGENEFGAVERKGNQVEKFSRRRKGDERLAVHLVHDDHDLLRLLVDELCVVMEQQGREGDRVERISTG